MHLKAALNPLGLRSLPEITASTLSLFLPTLPRHTPQSLESGGVRWGEVFIGPFLTEDV